jgi:hypothetical protein
VNIDATAGNAVNTSLGTRGNMRLNTKVLDCAAGLGGDFTLRTKFLVLNNSCITTTAGTKKRIKSNFLAATLADSNSNSLLTVRFP